MTPMMQQYFEIKNQYEGYLLFYRLGDFYEMFFDDALTASRELELTLTGRDCGEAERAPMCGVPFHSAEGYIAKLIEKGYKVAICEQMEACGKLHGVEMTAHAGSTDCNIPHNMGIPAVCFGVYKGKGAHTRGEWIDAESTKLGMKILASLIMDHMK